VHQRLYAPDRTAARPAEHLAGFRGILQVDGYAGFEQLAADGTVTLAACWSHARRKFYELHKAGSPVASEALARIAALYAIEADIRGQPPAERQRVRAQQSRPLVEALKLWLELKLVHLPGRSRLAEAIRYALTDGRGCASSWTTAGWTSIPTRSSGRSGLSLLEEKTLFLQAAMGAPDAGRWSGHWSKHASLMASSRMPGSGTC